MVYVAGQVLTAAEMNSWLPIVALKTASTSRASTTVQAADPDLSVTLLANCRYQIEVNLGVAGATAADVAIGYARTGTVVQVSSSTGREYLGPQAGTTDILNTTMRAQKSTASSPDSPAQYGIEATTGNIREVFWVDGGASGGTLTLTWAQFASNVTSTVLIGSMKATRVA